MAVRHAIMQVNYYVRIRGVLEDEVLTLAGPDSGNRRWVRLEELPAEARGPVLRAFLEQVRGGGRYFGSQTPDQVAAAAERYPVFRVLG